MTVMMTLASPGIGYVVAFSMVLGDTGEYWMWATVGETAMEVISQVAADAREKQRQQAARWN